jgi:hypothetical protein
MRITLLLSVLIVSSGYFAQVKDGFSASQDCSDVIDIQCQNNVKTCRCPRDWIRLSVATSRGDHLEVQVNVKHDEDITINFKKWNFSSGVSNIVLSGTAPYSAEDYAYLTNLISCAGFWSLPHRIDDPLTFDGNVTVLEASRDGHSYSVVIDGIDTNTPLRLARSFMVDSVPFSEQSDLRYWPKLAYSSLYDHVCLKFSGADLNARRDEWVTWRKQDDFFQLFGFPHEVRTSTEGVTWGYYLRDRGMMVVVFEHGSGQRQLSRRFLTYSNANALQIKREWLKSGSLRR